MNYQELAQNALENKPLDRAICQAILADQNLDLLSLLQAAYQVRKCHFDNEVTIHILNNAQNGHCPEDCAYCAQAKTSKADIEDYGLKSDSEILAEAKSAYNNGAHRYCMVFAGRGASQTRVKRLSNLIRTIKSRFPLEICVSTGLVDDHGAKELKEAGLDRLNHNLNTSEKYYEKICTTHTYEDRMQTLMAAKKNDLQVCSGLIVGMGETDDDVIDVAFKLRDIQAESIPVNFFMPIEGVALEQKPDMDPRYCLRVLSLFRFLNPQAEIRVAAGREMHLRSMQVMAFYPANSLFLEGYLNTRGVQAQETLQMLKDAGFTIKSDKSLDDLLAQEIDTAKSCPSKENLAMKDLEDLRPFV